MVAQDVSDAIVRQIASAVEIGESASDRVVLYSPFSHDDGDAISVVFTKHNSGRWRLSDEGEVLLHVGYNEVDLLSPGRVERFRRVVGVYGVAESDGELYVEVDGENFGEAFYRFTQACFEVARLSKLPPQKVRNTNT